MINTYNSNINVSGRNFLGRELPKLFNSDGSSKTETSIQEGRSLFSKASKDAKYTNVLMNNGKGGYHLQSVVKEKATKHGVHSHRTLGDKFYFIFKEARKRTMSSYFKYVEELILSEKEV